jgi:hypothetical protein
LAIVVETVEANRFNGGRCGGRCEGDGKECRESDDGGSELHGEDEEEVITECGLRDGLVMRMLASTWSFYILREPVQEKLGKTLNKLDNWRV